MLSNNWYRKPKPTLPRIHLKVFGDEADIDLQETPFRTVPCPPRVAGAVVFRIPAPHLTQKTHNA